MLANINDFVLKKLREYGDKDLEKQYLREISAVKRSEKDFFTVERLDRSGNSFSVISKVITCLKETGKEDSVEQYLKEATSGDYENLLKVSKKYLPALRIIMSEDFNSKKKPRFVQVTMN